MDGKFSISFDGQEAQMIITALREMAEGMQIRQAGDMYRSLANRIDEGKQSFHSLSYQIMAARYSLPDKEEGSTDALYSTPGEARGGFQVARSC